MRILVGVTGSVAAIKAYDIVDGLRRSGGAEVQVEIVSTGKGLHFLSSVGGPGVPVKVWTDEDEWKWEKRGDDVLHIKLRNWADIFLVAPIDANTLGKVSSGICDNLLTCILRAWDMTDKKKRVIMAPAMNTQMWNHPITQKQLTLLESDFKYEIIQPITKTLVCGDTGAMATVEEIIQTTFYSI